MPLTVPKSTEPWVGVELSPRFCSTSEPWQKTLTNSPRWNTPTSCRCCRSSSVVAALTTGRTAGEKHKEGRERVKEEGVTNMVGTGVMWHEQTESQRRKQIKADIHEGEKKGVKR